MAASRHWAIFCAWAEKIGGFCGFSTPSRATKFLFQLLHYHVIWSGLPSWALLNLGIFWTGARLRTEQGCGFIGVLQHFELKIVFRSVASTVDGLSLSPIQIDHNYTN